MTYDTIAELRSQLGKTPSAADDPVYAAKQLHRVPDAEVVDRAKFILQRVAGKRVVEYGASGPMHLAIMKAASEYWGWDRESAGTHVHGFNLDDVTQALLPRGGYQPPDIVVCGEVLEHLSNPGWFLTRLKGEFPGIPVIITVPNAHSASGVKSLTQGIENVNVEHCSWYSWRTLKTLVERVGYTIVDFKWYHGAPYFAEGLIMVVE